MSKESRPKLEKVRRGTRGARLYVPADISRHVPQDARFQCELTDEGILFRLVTEADPVLPAWTVS